MPLEIEGKESVKIPDGVHEGTISDLKKDIRGEYGYEYLDIYIELKDVKDSKGNHVKIKDGMPFNLTPNTKLGKTTMRFGTTEKRIASGEKLDLEQVFLGREVTFQTLEETTDKGTFARVVDGSLKPKV
jgi:hypothetical protein